MKIAVVQMDIDFANLERNFSKVEKFVEKGAMADSNVIVLSECGLCIK